VNEEKARLLALEMHKWGKRQGLLFGFFYGSMVSIVLMAAGYAIWGC
jgi:hypothetical protein